MSETDRLLSYALDALTAAIEAEPGSRRATRLRRARAAIEDAAMGRRRWWEVWRR